MKNKKQEKRDPRTETPPGHYFRQARWLPEIDAPTSFFSLRDTLLFGFLVLSCLVVGAVLWLAPPKYISFDQASPSIYDPAIAAKNIPKQLKNYPGYDTKRFEEIPDDDPSIAGDEDDLPMKEPDERPMPHTIKSEIKKYLNFLLAALRFNLTV